MTAKTTAPLKKDSKKPAVSTTHRTATTERMDALSMLSADHRKVEELFKEFEAAKAGNTKKSIVQKICDELTVHAMLEESAFYPVVRKKLRDDDMMDEAKVEHSSLKWLIAQLEEESPSDDLYDAKVTVLKEYVSHHVKEEEQEMFKKIRATDMDIEELGQFMQVVKKEIKSELVKH
jgi:hemerythrin superfamily protein